MSGVEGVEREDYDDSQAGVENGFRLSAIGFRIWTALSIPSGIRCVENPHFSRKGRARNGAPELFGAGSSLRMKNGSARDDAQVRSKNAVR